MKSLSIKKGAQLGAWLVLSRPIREIRKSTHCTNYIVLYRCRCVCGTVRLVRAFKLLSNSRSCGCVKAANLGQKTFVHGHNKTGHRTRLYRIWSGMIQRCTNKNNTGYQQYGARGIYVCDAWRSFDVFRVWAESNNYQPLLQLDRRDNAQGYNPANCRWVTDAQNKRNTTRNKLVVAFGETKCITDWALDARCFVTPATVSDRLKRGWTPEKAVAFPRQTKKTSPQFIGHHTRLNRT